MIRKVKIMISASVTIAVMVAIFFFTSEDGEKSASSSIGVTRPIAETIIANFDETPARTQDMIVEGLHGFIRKTAHFVIFAALGVSAFATCRYIFMSFRKKVIVSVLFCACYAAFDEMRQTFVPGRTGRVTDVLLDTCGSVFGIILALLCLSVFAVLHHVMKSSGIATENDEIISFITG